MPTVDSAPKWSAEDLNKINTSITQFIKNVNTSILASTKNDIDLQIAYYEKASNRLIEEEENRRKQLENKIAELRVSQILKSEEDAFKYRETQEQLAIQQRKKRNREAAEDIKKTNEELYKLAFENVKKEEEEKNKSSKQRRKEEEKNKKKEEIKNKLTSDDEKTRAQGLKEAKKEESKETFVNEFKETFSKFNEQRQDPTKTAVETMSKNLTKTLQGVGKAISDGLNQINTSISKYAQYQTAINTRLQGYSDFSTITKTLGDVAFSPLLNAETLYSNLNTLVGEGIGFDIEQRAFLMTIKDSIATTFDANAAYLKRMVRIQQEDSTAARLGMESYLTKWLNEYVKNTEYLTSTFDSVASSLFEASSLLKEAVGTGASEEFEYVVQKWMGALTGVGMSDETAQQLAAAIGALGSGDVSGLGSGIYNLLTMAASKQGMSLGNILNKGMDAYDVNDLLYGVTAYMKELQSYNSNVVKSQLSKTFGINVSDLLATVNLEQKDLTTIYNNMMSTNDMYSELTNQVKTVNKRIGISNILENMFSNLTFQTGMNIAANPVTYAMWKITDLIQGVTGGINIPFITALGSGVDLNTTVENLMKIGIVGTSTLGNIGKIASGLSSLKDGSVLLKAFDISSGNAMMTRGSGVSEYVGEGAKRRKQSGIEKSSSSVTYIGEEDSSAYKESSLAAAKGETESANPDNKDNDLKNLLYDRSPSIGSLLESIDKNIADVKEKGLSITGLSDLSSIKENTSDVSSNVETIAKNQYKYYTYYPASPLNTNDGFFVPKNLEFSEN